MRAVCAGRGRAASDEQLEGLWLLVNELDFGVFERAYLAAARETRYLPTAADIHAYARKQQADQAVRPEVLAALADGEIHCQLCDDTGWEPCTRDGSRVYGAGVTVPAVRVCRCRATNPIYQAHRAAQRRVGTREEA